MWATTWATWPAWAPTSTRATAARCSPPRRSERAAFATADGMAMQLSAVLAPMLIAAVGIVLSIIGIFLVRNQ